MLCAGAWGPGNPRKKGMDYSGTLSLKPSDVSTLRSSVLGLQAVEIADDIFGNAGLADRARGRGWCLLGSNQGQFAGIEPVDPAVGALVHFDPAFGAEEVGGGVYAGAAG